MLAIQVILVLLAPLLYEYIITNNKMNYYKLLSLLLSISLFLTVWKLSTSKQEHTYNKCEVKKEQSLFQPSEKIKLQTAKLSLAVKPVVVVGSYDNNGTPNIMTASWTGIVNSDPPMVAVSIRPSRYSFQNIKENDAFTINIPHKDQWYEADYVGTHSGRDGNKFAKLHLNSKKAENINAPFVTEFPLGLGCRVVKKIELGSHVQFIGEVVEVEACRNILTETKSIDMEKLQPFVLGEDQYYWSIGSRIEKAFSTKMDK